MKISIQDFFIASITAWIMKISIQDFFSKCCQILHREQGIILVSLLLTLNIFHTFFTCNCRLGEKDKISILMDKVSYFSIANNFKEFFSNLAQNLAGKLPTGRNKFDIISVWEFYKPLEFHFTKVPEKVISDFLKELKLTRQRELITYQAVF